VADGLIDEVVGIIGSVLAARGAGDVALSADSGMGNPPAWDSLAFVEIFTTVSEKLGLDVSDDDAIHFMTVREIVEFASANRN
jgi:acyl carrier protein